MTPELIAILSVWVASFLGLAGLMLTLFTRLERRMDRMEARLQARMDRMEARLQALEQGQAELKGIVDVIRESLFQRNVS
jgi:hypothetical protein